MSSETRTSRAEMKYARMSAFKIRDLARCLRKDHAWRDQQQKDDQSAPHVSHEL